MAGPGSVDRIAAVVAALGAVVVGGWFLLVGIEAELGDVAGRPSLDRVLPFLLAALAAAVFGRMAWRSWQRARDADAAAHPGSERDHDDPGTPGSGTTGSSG